MHEFKRSFCKLLLITILLQTVNNNVSAQTEVLPSGSFIINMGATNPNTIANGLKPYGLIYDLLRNNQIPVKWVINPAKGKDGIDFIYNGVAYRGGTFIIPADFRTAAVNSRITFWMGRGVVGVTTTSSLTVPVAQTLKTIPKWTLDSRNGAIAEKYLLNAGINNIDFPGAYNWKNPQLLDGCDDFFVMPHADPVWSTHGNLFAWNRDYFGSIWADCHAVSALENSINPANSAQQMNFLTTRTATVTPLPWPNNSLKLWGTHSGGSVPYMHQYPTDPVAQYLGTTDAAQLNGSEQKYIPKQATDPGGATRWRPGVKMIAYDPSQINIPSPNLANGNIAAAMLYGRAFDDPARGYVMYVSGHSHNKGTVADVAVQRTFLNFSFFQVAPKAPVLSVSGINPGIQVQGGTNINNLTVAVTSPFPANTFTYFWSSTCGGTFSAPNAATSNYTAPVVGVSTNCLIICKVIDQCGRVSFQTFPITVTPGPLPPTPQNDTKTVASACNPGVPITINTLANDTDPQGSPITFTSLNQPGSPVNAGTWSATAAGIVTFTPDPNFSGPATITYTVTNGFGMTANATITVNIGTPDSKGCFPNQVWGIANKELLTVANVVANTGTTAAMTNGDVNDPRLDFTESAFLSSSNTLGDIVDLGTSTANYFDLQLPYALNIDDTVVVYWGKRTNNGTTVLAMYQSANNTFGGAATNYTITGTGNLPTSTRYPILANGTNYIRIKPGTGTSQQLYIDAVEFEDWSCVSRKPQAGNDTYLVLEDVPTVLTVLDNDYDPTGSGMKITSILSAPTNGAKVSINNNGTITFVTGYDNPSASTFSYQVCNNQGYCSTASVTVSINADGCGAGQYRPNPPGGAITKVFQYQFAGANAATGNATVANFRDSWLRQDNATTNYGTSTTAEVGKNLARRGVWYFNVSEIPSSAIVQSANFSILRTGGDGITQPINLSALTRGFVESKVTWNIAAAGTNWTTAGGDFGATLTSSTVTSALIRTNWNIAGLAQSWVTTPANNFGLLLKTDELLNKRHIFALKEDATITNRPALNITCVVPDPCTAIPNRNPLANPDIATTNSKTSITVPVLANDTDPDPAQTVSLLSIGAVVNGTAVISGNNIIFTPTFGFNGLATVIYNIQDNGTGNLQDQAIIYITVINAPPTAINEFPAGVNSGIAQTVNIGTNDSDPEGGALTWTIYRDGNYTSVPTVISAAPSTITYTPISFFTGQDTVFYYIQEPNTGCSNGERDSAYVVFTVLNRNPIAVDDAKSGRPCQTSRINVTSNDTDPEGNNLTVTNISALSNPASGTLVNNQDGSVSFMPAMGFTGVVTFTYTVTDDGVPPQTSSPATVTITITAAPNNPPVAVNDYSDTTNMDEPVYQNVLDNDSDPDNNALANPTVIVNPMHGTVSVLQNGLVKYIPNPGFYGTDSLTYQVCDIDLIPATCVQGPALCATAKVYYYIIPPNTTLALNDENSTWVNTPVSGATLSNDYDPEGNYPASFLGFVIGGVSYSTGIQTVGGFDDNGGAVANAGTLTINANGTYLYTPASNFSGVINIPYAMKDANINAAYDTADLRITVSPFPGIANSVIANNDENRVFGGVAISNTLFNNDWDPQNNSFSLTSFKYDTDGDGTPDGNGTLGSPVTVGGKTATGLPVSNTGSLTINANGTYTFTPAPDFHGSVDLPYTICDNLVPAACATAILHIDVMIDANGPANDPPQAGDDFAYSNINTPVTSTFIANDSEPNNDPISLSGVTINTGGPVTPIGGLVPTAKGGTVQFYANGTFKYTPANGYVGPDSIGYQICDVTVVAPQPLCNRAFLHLLVGENNTTNAINDENSTWQDVNVSGNMLTNDFDAESNIQTFGSLLQQNLGSDISSGSVLSGVDKTGAPFANAGIITFDANSNYTFDPVPAFTGTVTVPYRLCDNGNLPKCDTAFLTITVDPLPTTGLNTVIANNDENICYGPAVSGNLFVNDRDPQNDAFTVTSFAGGTVGTPGTVSGVDLYGITVANAGTLTINANGTYTFTPQAGFVGSVSVPYTITDAFGATSVAMLHIDVLKDPNGPANDPPIAGDDFGYTTINKPVTASFIINDSDPNGNPVSYNGVTINTGGAHTAIGAALATVMGGTLQFYSDGTYTYTPPAGYVGPDRLTYLICDVTAVAPQPLCADATIHLLVGPGINIAGRVWDDANGNVVINGGENQTNAGNTLYVNVVDVSANVVAAVAVSAGGTYSFTDVTPGVNYSLVLSTTLGTVGQSAPAPALPAGWTNTGENRNGIIDGGTAGVIDTRNYGFTHTINFDFGIEQLPNTDNHTTNIPQPKVGDYITLNGGANPPVLSGIDPEDCNAGCNLASKAVIIDAVPANAQLYYNGALVTSGQQVNNFNPNLLQVKMTSATVGATSASFQYSYLDLAGKKDPTPATYTLTWLFPLPVILSSFTGMPNKCDAVLQWKTAQEINTEKFVIEQSSNGLNFTIVGEVKAANSATGKSYQTAISQAGAIKYYRLKILDKDGGFNYSPIITLRTSCGTGDYFFVYPNPVSTNLTVSFYTRFKGQLNLVIVNAVGQQLTCNKIQVTSAANTINLDMSNYLPGVYLLNLVDDSGVKIGEVQKIIKN